MQRAQKARKELAHGWYVDIHSCGYVDRRPADYELEIRRRARAGEPPEYLGAVSRIVSYQSASAKCAAIKRKLQKCKPRDSRRTIVEWLESRGHQITTDGHAQLQCVFADDAIERLAQEAARLNISVSALIERYLRAQWAALDSLRGK